ncbi:CaiB/BaiF CoA transferase family protein [Tenacibaculum aiptasiae]|uniref:CaiB/BaiF CoA transferase family protein n=1 Tax=Tenacibaculum aiptasiae TaxID=426481 RepID=UPI003B5AD691
MLPLKGIKIIDFSRLLPGPLGTQILKQLGAEVIKIESPKRMDYTRYYEPKIEQTSTMFYTLNYGKEALVIDYEEEKGYSKIIELIKESDVFIEQFRPEVMKGFRLDFDTVKKINPTIVYISVTGYGQNSKFKNKAGHDLNYIAQAGLLDLNKDEKGKPVIPGYQVADIAGGSYMLVSACTTALLAKHKQQKAQYVDVNLSKATMPLNAIAQGMEYQGASYKKTPILSGMMVNYNVYECADKKWIALGALETKFWNSFCDKIDEPSWKTNNQFDLIAGVFDKTLLENLFSSKTRDEWVDFFENEDICISPVLEINELIDFHTKNNTDVFEKVMIDNNEMYIYKAPFLITN